ncbi:hypothetical protein L2K70_17310 [Nocardioides KLBMP 9356]|uniref:DUF4386 family protein n=1 Tax=Nocardioides potassii TaxID=2911371 RepID=A0ABS9HDV5_9ACTN|nr:hypothetical protein [Nocardioides potassii]MCF6379372.1 hypothetical protein [Nocardioides potassii]
MNSTTAGIAPVSTTPADATVAPSTKTAVRPFGAAFAATALVLGAAGNTAQAVMTQLLGGRPETIDDMVALASDSPTLVTAMSVTGTVALPFMALGFVAAAHLLTRRARRAGGIAGTLLVLGMWGFLGLQLTGLVQIRALLDGEAGLAAATWMQSQQQDPLLGVLFALPFMAGTVIGMLVLTIGLLVRGAGVPRWIPGAWLVFIVLDFTIGAVGPVDPHWLYFIGAVGLAHHVLQDGARAWKNA